jgi:hypothetical protein
MSESLMDLKLVIHGQTRANKWVKTHKNPHVSDNENNSFWMLFSCSFEINHISCEYNIETWNDEAEFTPVEILANWWQSLTQNTTWVSSIRNPNSFLM